MHVLLTLWKHLIELASCQPDTLSADRGSRVAIADLLQAIRDFDSLHVELASVTRVRHYLFLRSDN